VGSEHRTSNIERRTSNVKGKGTARQAESWGGISAEGFHVQTAAFNDAF
jgi:hypothetical protein